MNIRIPLPNELPKIFEMGYANWPEGLSLEGYIQKTEKIMQATRAQWLVLEKDGQIVTTMLVHQFDQRVFGLGSISTPPEHQRKGYASQMIHRVVKNLSEEKLAETIYLYSEINPEFYERFGFCSLPEALQTSKGSTCMAWTREKHADLTGLKPPGYF